jgi:hypothetical protein
MGAPEAVGWVLVGRRRRRLQRAQQRLAALLPLCHPVVIHLHIMNGSPSDGEFADLAKYSIPTASSRLLQSTECAQLWDKRTMTRSLSRAGHDAASAERASSLDMWSVDATTAGAVRSWGAAPAQDVRAMVRRSCTNSALIQAVWQRLDCGLSSSLHPYAHRHCKHGSIAAH